jgi:hypothetical protein
MPKKDSEPKITIAEIVAKDKRRFKLKLRAADLSGKVEKLSSEIISGMKTLKVKSVESDGWQVSYAQAEPVVYDPALVMALSPAQRRLACDEIVDLNALPDEARKRVLKALTPAVRKQVTMLRLNVDKLSQAVQQEAIPLELVSRYSSVQPKKAYITPSSGPVKR